MDLLEAEYLAKFYIKKYNLNCNFEFEDSIKRRGSFNHRLNVLRLSSLITSIRDKNFVINTIKHEIAHGLVGPGHGHNDVWKNKAIEIGCNINIKVCPGADICAIITLLNKNEHETI